PSGCRRRLTTNQGGGDDAVWASSDGLGRLGGSILARARRAGGGGHRTDPGRAPTRRHARRRGGGKFGKTGGASRPTARVTRHTAAVNRRGPRGAAPLPRLAHPPRLPKDRSAQLGTCRSATFDSDEDVGASNKSNLRALRHGRRGHASGRSRQARGALTHPK